MLLHHPGSASRRPASRCVLQARGLGFRVQGLGFRVWGLFRAQFRKPNRDCIRGLSSTSLEPPTKALTDYGFPYRDL